VKDLVHQLMADNPNLATRHGWGVLKVGDTVLWSGGWGLDAEREVKVLHIEADIGDSKYGTPVQELSWGDVPLAVVDLDNGHWAYGLHIRRLA
jgi:hypothetical protein